MGNELQNLDMTEDKNYPSPGDLIEIKSGGSYEHWALYIGKGHVIHMTPLGKAGAAWLGAEGVLWCSRSPFSLHGQSSMWTLCV